MIGLDLSQIYAIPPGGGLSSMPAEGQFAQKLFGSLGLDLKM